MNKNIIGVLLPERVDTQPAEDVDGELQAENYFTGMARNRNILQN